MSFNPSTATVVGNEWPVLKDSPRVLNAGTPALGVSVPSRSAEDIKQVKTYLSVTSAGRLAVDVYDSTVDALAAVTQQTGLATAPVMVPVSDVTIFPSIGVGVSNWSVTPGAPATAFDKIDDGVVVDTANYASHQGNNFLAYLEMRLGWSSTVGKFTAAGLPAFSGKRIVGVNITAIAEMAPGSTKNGQLYLGFSGAGMGGVRLGPARTISATGGQQTVNAFFPVNPATSRPWTPSDLEKFTTAVGTANLYVRWSAAALGSAATVRIYNVYVQPLWVEETRAATGEATVTATGWQTVTTTTPEYHNRFGTNQSNFDLASAAATPIAWVGSGAPVPTVARQTVVGNVRSGAGSLQITATGAGDMTVIPTTLAGFDTRDTLSVIEGETYTMSAYFKANAAVRSCRCGVIWYDENGAQIGSTVVGANVTDSAANFNTRATLSATAPLLARYALPFVQILAAANGEIHFMDEVMFERSPSVSTFVNGGAAYSVAGTQVWRKHNAVTNVVAFRRITGNFSIPGLDSAAAMPHGVANALVPVTAVGGDLQSGLLGTTSGDWPTLLTAASPVVLIRSDNAASGDSQPYVAISTEEVTSTNTLRQEVTAPAGIAIALVSFLVRQKKAASTQNLLVKVKRASDNVQVGSTFTVTSNDMEDYTSVQAFLGSIGSFTSAAIQYYIEWTTAATTGNGWLVTVLDTKGQGNNAGYGSTVDQFTGQAGEQASKDAAANISSLPAAPSGFTATVLPAADSDPCDLDDPSYVHLTWTPVVGSFSNYEIQRDTGDGFVIIAQILTQATATYDDPEGPLGDAASYRMRYIRGDYIESTFSSSISRTAAASKCKWQLTSGRLPSSMWVQGSAMNGGEIEFEFDDHRIVLDEFDSDDRVAYIGTERRGDRFQLDLLVYGANDQLVPAALAGRRAFDAVRAVSLASIPYVCVRNSDGDVWYATVRVGSGIKREPGGRYYAQLEVTELSAAPYVGYI